MVSRVLIRAHVVARHALGFDRAEGAVLPAFLMVIFQDETTGLKAHVDVPDVPRSARPWLGGGRRGSGLTVLLRGVANDPLELILPRGGLWRWGPALSAPRQGDDAATLHRAEGAKERAHALACIADVELRALAILIVMADGECMQQGQALLEPPRLIGGQNGGPDMMAQGAPAVVLTRTDRLNGGENEVKRQFDVIRRAGWGLDGGRQAGVSGVSEGDPVLLVEDETAGPDFGLEARCTAFGNRQNDLLRKPGRGMSTVTPIRLRYRLHRLQDSG